VLTARVSGLFGECMHAEIMAQLYPLFQFYLPNFPHEVCVGFLGLAREPQAECPAARRQC
jgi:hypothetical protein